MLFKPLALTELAKESIREVLLIICNKRFKNSLFNAKIPLTFVIEVPGIQNWLLYITYSIKSIHGNI